VGDTARRLRLMEVSPFWSSSPEDDEVLALLAAAGYTEVAIQRRKVRGGVLRAIRHRSPPDRQWHMTLVYQPRRKRTKQRFPTWAEATEARNELPPENLDVILHLPNAELAEDMTLHLYQA
jgi:hypothetical protein